MRKTLVGIVLMLLIASAVLPAVGIMNIDKNQEEKTSAESNGSSKKIFKTTSLPGWFLAFVNGDWDYWSNPPHMYAIPNGNIGIGTINPDAEIHIMGNNDPEILIESTAQNSIPNIKLKTISSGEALIIKYDTGRFALRTGGPNDLQLATHVGGTFTFSIGTNDVLEIDSSGDVNIDGKATIHGGIDPPYISFSKETHESIRKYAESVEDHEEVMQFWNGDAHRMEIYVISEDAFYTINGELI